MMDALQRKTVERYTALLKQTKNKAELVGRHKEHLKSSKAIFNDIDQKLEFSPRQRVLDLGCGVGSITDLVVSYAEKNQCDLTLFDIPAVADQLDALYQDRHTVVSGVFPYEVPKGFLNQKFDRILAYSVIHYTSQPMHFIAALVKMLKPQGRLLIGDIPNVNRKGRFLTSDYGRQFEASYRGVSLQKLEKYSDHHEYARTTKNQNRKISDALLMKAMKNLRGDGYDVFLLPQEASLPFSKTREDLVIVRP